jgi:hypothetical protein
VKKYDVYTLASIVVMSPHLSKTTAVVLCSFLLVVAIIKRSR